MYTEIKYLLMRDLWDKEIFLINSLTKLAKHSKYNSSLQEFNNVINWEIFRDDLEPMYKYTNCQKYFPILLKMKLIR